jgi:hypothetical protein
VSVIFPVQDSWVKLYSACVVYVLDGFCLLGLTQIYIQLFQLRLSPEQSGKVEYERERLLGIANKLMNWLAIPSSLSRSYSTFPLCSGDNLNWNRCMLYFLCKTHVSEHVNNRSDYAKWVYFLAGSPGIKRSYRFVLILVNVRISHSTVMPCSQKLADQPSKYFNKTLTLNWPFTRTIACERFN